MRHLIPVLLLALAVPVAAQDVGFTLGARGDAAIPTGDDFDDAKTGFGFGIEGALQFTPILGLYASFSQFSFGVDEDDPDFDGDYKDTGFALGAHINIPVSAEGPAFSPWLRVGAIYNVFEITASGMGLNLAFDSDRTLGFEVGAGMDYPLGESGVLLQPAVRYRAYEPEVEAFDENLEASVSYFALGVGLAYRFGGTPSR